MTEFQKAFTIGYECVSAWSDLLDRINVFPVADGDTGTNLRISLAPFRDPAVDRGRVVDQLGLCATGNSGNIAAAFFQEFVQAGTAQELSRRAAAGRDRAWRAVAKPRSGTMLSVFDALAQTLEHQEHPDNYHLLRTCLSQAVLSGPEILPDLQKAGVVDAGALAMFIFLDGFFQQIDGHREISVDVYGLFSGKLRIDRTYRTHHADSFCVDAVLETDTLSSTELDELSGLGESVVLSAHAERLKLHIHTPDPKRLRMQLRAFGSVVDWSDEVIDQSRAQQLSEGREQRPVHLVSDAAGSFTRELARQYGVSLLDSYIIADGQCRPESLCCSETLYAQLRAGRKVTTAQASTFERHLHYETICRELGRTLYLCVGSAFTGNYATAMAWKETHDPDDLFEVLDTGAASGRLGLIILLTSRFARAAKGSEEVVRYARKRIGDTWEYVFIDQLKYLVAGGRVSRAGGFFGDLLHMKPIVSPTSSGVKKIGVVRNREAQLAFALEKLRRDFKSEEKPVIMLQYSDNREWVSSEVQNEITDLLPEAELVLTPLSLTSGVHMGPGTWALAVSPAGAQAYRDV